MGWIEKALRIGLAMALAVVMVGCPEEPDVEEPAESAIDELRDTQDSAAADEDPYEVDAPIDEVDELDSPIDELRGTEDEGELDDDGEAPDG